MTTRREFLKVSSMFGAGLSIPTTFNIINKPSLKGPIIGHGEHRYRLDKEWGTQKPNRIPVKNCHEMIQDNSGRLILLTDHLKNNIIIYNLDGKVKDTWTLNLPGAHGLTHAEISGEEFLFITDTEINKVYKTTLAGKVMFELSFPRESGVYQEASQWKPTEVAVLPDGSFYVADGYGLNYITKFSAEGEYQHHFGGKGQENDLFDCCHGIALDTRPGKGEELLITSRSTQQFKRFSLDGKHLETIDLNGCSICRPVIRDGLLYFAVIVTKDWWNYDGMVAVLDSDNNIISLPGGTSPLYTQGGLEPPTYDGTSFMNPHDVCIDQDGNIYVPQWYSGKTYPVRLVRV